MSDEVTTQDDNNPSRMQRVKQHVKKHQTKYAIVVSVVGASGITYALTKRFGMPDLPSISNEPVCTFGDVTESTVLLDQSQNVVQHITNMANGGYCCKVVQDAADPTKLWPRIQDFCEEVGAEKNVDPDQVRRMANRYWRGEIADVFGRYPLRYGVATTTPKVA